MSEKTKKQRLRIWHVINPPRDLFKFEVANIAVAIVALHALAEYDLFVGDGEDKPWTTVGGRAKKRRELAMLDGTPSPILKRMLEEYDRYQLEHSPSGVPFVVANAQGLEQLEHDTGLEDWCEFYDDEGDDIHALSDRFYDGARKVAGAD